MSWMVRGAWFTTSELDGTSLVGQRIRFNKDIVVRGIRPQMIFYNDPTFTSLYFRIYSDRAGVPGKLLYTSSSKTKAEIITLENGVKEPFFSFDLPTFKGTDWFHIVPIAVGYTGSDTSHIGWRKAWPDPIYRTGLTTTYTSWASDPYMIHIIGAEL